jgi:uncharacterized cupredoxin-like copper-binding protein
MRRFLRHVLVVAAIVLTACPGGRGQDESQTGPSKGSTTTANPQSVPEPSTTMNPGSVVPIAAAQPVQVQLTEYEIRMPETLPAGRTNFHIANAGKQNHNFAIEGNSLQMKLSSDLTRGDWAPLTIDLKPGVYTAYCPVDGHRKRGMQRVLTVK